MKNSINAEERLKVYEKALKIYENRSWPQGWLEDVYKVGTYSPGLCQSLRCVYTGHECLSDAHTFPDETRWEFESTPSYFPEFRKHFPMYKSLEHEERIEVLKKCIADLKA